MKIWTLIILVIAFITLLPGNLLSAEDGRYLVVIEESFYTIKPENEEKFLEIHKNRVFPFWAEMKEMGLIDGDIRMYSQRIHSLKPEWTYKTVIRFRNYAAIDKWLEKRDEVYKKLFPGEVGYRELRKQISSITEEHWDELIREIPLE